MAVRQIGAAAALAIRISGRRREEERGGGDAYAGAPKGMRATRQARWSEIDSDAASSARRERRQGRGRSKPSEKSEDGKEREVRGVGPWDTHLASGWEGLASRMATR
ncbi:hypothetical protein E2562_003461 [Oryza meyeriana var. granulata]|uniref:DUF834 domain-containing protein n=1 Tax=Oryza meyeriana var. granulata TaxID=110450 RepID=A0A6G1CMR8_9ORYZ|nr:hypothetical protein E2562_003461 [Oryza meyeriana var. granulata]